jgi:hypothetical protein
MIYKVNKFYVEPEYFDEATNPNAKAEAEALLAQVRVEVLEKEAVRFSICAEFVVGSDTTWRAIQDTDPEDTSCLVLDTSTGTYTKVNNKTEAYALNEQIKQNFLSECMLDTLVEITDMSMEPVNNVIPVTEA